MRWTVKARLWPAVISQDTIVRKRELLKYVIASYISWRLLLYRFIWRTRFLSRSAFVERYMLWPGVCLSVCLSVHHTPILHRNGWTDQDGFRHRSFPQRILCCLWENSGISKNKGNFCNLFFQTTDFFAFVAAHRPSPVLLVSCGRRNVITLSVHLCW